MTLLCSSRPASRGAFCVQAGGCAAQGQHRGQNPLQVARLPAIGTIPPPPRSARRSRRRPRTPQPDSSGNGHRLRKARQPVHEGDQDVLQPPVLQLAHHRQPEPGAVVGLAGAQGVQHSPAVHPEVPRKSSCMLPSVEHGPDQSCAKDRTFSHCDIPCQILPPTTANIRCRLDPVSNPLPDGNGRQMPSEPRHELSKRYLRQCKCFTFDILCP